MSEKTNILGLIGYTFLPPRSGGHRAIDEGYEALGRIHNVSIYGTSELQINKGSHSYKILDQNIGSERSPLRYINLLLFFRLLKILKENKIDVLQIDQPYYGWLGLLIKWFTKTRYYQRSHNIEYLRFKEIGKWWWPIMKVYESLVTKWADRSLFITEEDLAFAEKKWKLKKAGLFRFGTWIDQNPSQEKKKALRAKIIAEHSLPKDCKIVNFNGPMAYYANKDALHTILTELAPRILIENPKVHIILCGSQFPEEYQETLDGLQNVQWAGFVDDLNEYLMASDQFWNPIQLGGGIKTKLIQALSQGLTVISYRTGAIGIDQNSTGDKLITLGDGDYQSFSQKALQEIDLQTPTPSSFYENYYWMNIVKSIDYSI